MNIREKIYNFKTKHKQGFIQSEVEALLKDYPEVDMKKFNNALMGNTCMMSDENEFIMYHCDIYKALICGIEKRDLKSHEWD